MAEGRLRQPCVDLTAAAPRIAWEMPHECRLLLGDRVGSRASQGGGSSIVTTPSIAGLMLFGSEKKSFAWR